MKKPQHTPGPWRLAFPLGVPEIVTDGPALHCKTVCSGLPQFHLDAATTCANGRLIAAAPELLAALERIASNKTNGQLATDGNGDEHSLWDLSAGDCADIACEAIAKARAA